jgi:adenylylsulfate kinase-like enzyme
VSVERMILEPGRERPRTTKTIWLTGLSGSGKSTIAVEADQMPVRWDTAAVALTETD